MCRAADEGGLRCAAHTRPQYLAATIGTPEWDIAASEYAATREGEQHIAGQAQTASREVAIFFHQALHRGRALREASDSAAEAVRAARAAAHVDAGTGTEHTYSSRTGTYFTCHSLTNLRRDAARDRDTHAVSADITGRVTAGYREAPDPQLVTGRITITHNGRGQGWTVSAGERELRCHCADYRARYDCQHVQNLLAEVAQRVNAESVGPRHAGIVLESRREAMLASLNRVEVREPGPHETDPSDDAAFDRQLQDAVAHRNQPLTYRTENVLAGFADEPDGRGFGVEIEFAGGDTVAIGQDLYAAGLTPSPNQRGYASGRQDVSFEHHRGWRYEDDSTVSGEIITPVLRDTPESWEQIAAVCEIVRRNGGRATSNAGAHVHVSTADYRHDWPSHRRLLDIFNDHEDLMYRLATNPAAPMHRLAAGSAWCPPNRHTSHQFTNVGDAWTSGLNLGRTALNLSSVNGSNSDNVEFRVWDASLDPAVIQRQVSLSVAMVEAARRDAGYQSTGRQHVYSSSTQGVVSHDAVRRLTNLLYRGDADKRAALDLYVRNEWPRAAR